MGTFFTLMLAAFLLLVTTVIVMVIAERNDPEPRRVYGLVRALAVIAFTLLVMREFIMLIVVSRP